LTKGRIVAAHGCFNGIQQVALVWCTPLNNVQYMEGERNGGDERGWGNPAHPQPNSTKPNRLTAKSRSNFATCCTHRLVRSGVTSVTFARFVIAVRLSREINSNYEHSYQSLSVVQSRSTCAVMNIVRPYV